MADTVTFDFAPTAYETERQKQAKQTPKKFASEGKKQLAIATRRYAMTLRNSTTGQQYQALLHVASIAKEYDIALDVYYRWMLAVHEARENSYE